MKNNNYIYYIFAGIFVILAVASIFNEDVKMTDDDISMDTEIITQLNSTPDLPLPTPTPKIIQTIKPSPVLLVEEVDPYSNWVKELDPESRRLSIANDDCSQLVPSNVIYPNNTKIMLDNSFSDKAHILKIGDNEYSLDARGWLIVTLSSSQLPAKLPIYCGSMELGQIDLQ